MPIRDDRRRRLLNEEILGAAARDAAEEEEASVESPGRSTSRRTARYAKAADMSNQPRVTDLVPQRKLTIFLLVMLGLGIIAGLEALYWWMPRLAKATQTVVAQVDAEHEAQGAEEGGPNEVQAKPGKHKHSHKPPKPKDGRIAAFDLDGEGSLGAGFSAALLALSGVTAVLIYSLRRHRLDDYGGHYRLWLWAATCWFVMSMDEACTLHEGFKEMMVYFTGQRIYGDGSMWWVIPYAVILNVTGLLVLWDMRKSWFASLSFLATGAFFATAVAAQLGFLMRDMGAREVMVEEGCEMLGDLCLLLSMVTYARHIIREIDGTAGKKPRKAKSKEGKSPESATKTAKTAAASLADGVVAATSTAASMVAPGVSGKVEARATGQVRKDQPHAMPSGPAGKPMAPATNKAKMERRGR